MFVERVRQILLTHGIFDVIHSQNPSLIVSLNSDRMFRSMTGRYWKKTVVWLKENTAMVLSYVNESWCLNNVFFTLTNVGFSLLFLLVSLRQVVKVRFIFLEDSLFFFQKMLLFLVCFPFLFNLHTAVEGSSGVGFTQVCLYF